MQASENTRAAQTNDASLHRKHSLVDPGSSRIALAKDRYRLYRSRPQTMPPPVGARMDITCITRGANAPGKAVNDAIIKFCVEVKVNGGQQAERSSAEKEPYARAASIAAVFGRRHIHRRVPARVLMPVAVGSRTVPVAGRSHRHWDSLFHRFPKHSHSRRMECRRI